MTSPPCGRLRAGVQTARPHDTQPAGRPLLPTPLAAVGSFRFVRATIRWRDSEKLGYRIRERL